MQTTFKPGDRILTTMLEDGSIGELEFIEPTPSANLSHIVFHAKWWDGEPCGKAHAWETARIVERTPDNLNRAGKQTFAAQAARAEGRA